MTRQLILVILAFNTVVIAIGIIAYLLIHQSHRAVDAEELQRRVSEGLASVTTPAEMQRSSAAIAKMAADTHRLVHSSVAFLEHACRFLVLIGGLNISLVLLGVWHHKNVLRSKSSNQMLEPTAGRCDDGN